MKTLLWFLAIVMVVAIVGGVVYLETWGQAPPTASVEKVIPSDRFAK